MPKHLSEVIFVLVMACIGIWQTSVWLGYITEWIFEKLKPKRPVPKFLDAVDVINHDMVEHKLEGPILKRLIIYPAEPGAPRTQRITGPIMQMVGGTLEKHTAMEVVTDMLIQYALSRQLGVNMTPAQAMVCVRFYFQIEIKAVPAEEE